MPHDRAAIRSLYASYPISTTHAECVALSRRKGRDREQLADAAAARGDQEAAAEHRRVAKLYREEANAQEPYATPPKVEVTGGTHPARGAEPGTPFRRVLRLPID